MWIVRIDQDRDATRVGYELFQQFESLALKIVSQVRQTGEIAPGSAKILYAKLVGAGNQRCYNWCPLRNCHRRADGRCPVNDENLNIQID
jgi:hypothetical protein